LIREDREPPHRYTDAVVERLRAMGGLDPRTQAMLGSEKPDEVYVSALKNGAYAVLNYNAHESRVTIPGRAPITIAPFGIAVIR
jgi:hypothetical protein